MEKQKIPDEPPTYLKNRCPECTSVHIINLDIELVCKTCGVVIEQNVETLDKPQRTIKGRQLTERGKHTKEPLGTE